MTTVVHEQHTAARRSRDAERARDARVVGDARAGDQAAFGELYDIWFDRVYDVARRIVRDPDTAAEVAQDAFLDAWRGLAGLREPASFGGWMLRIARNRGLNRWQRERRSQPAESPVLEAVAADDPRAADRVARLGDPARLVEDAELAELVDGAALALGPRDASILDLHLRHGLEPSELAEELGLNRNAAKQVLHRVRHRLGDAIGARVLWRGGDPRCEVLAELLTAAGITAFGPVAARLIKEHADDCAECSQRRETRLSPAVLFSAVPVGVAPALLKQGVAEAMEAEGGPRRHRGRGRPGPRMAAQAAAAAAVVTLVIVAAVKGGAGEGGDFESPQLKSGPSAAASGPGAKTVADPGAPAGNQIEGALESPGSITLEPPPAAPGGSDAPAPGGDAGPDPAPAPPPGPPAAPPPPPPPAIKGFGVSPSSAPTTYAMSGAPVLSWSVSAGGGSVSVSGPGVSSSAFSGSQSVCPGTIVRDRCSAAPGTYSFLLSARDHGGQVVDQRTAVLTIR